MELYIKSPSITFRQAIYHGVSVSKLCRPCLLVVDFPRFCVRQFPQVASIVLALMLIFRSGNPDYSVDMLPGGLLLAIQQHGFTWLVILIEAFLVRHVYGRKRLELPMWLSFCLIYLMWNIICWRVNNVRKQHFTQVY